jgi:FtsZ-interacting cell division protein ZipA
MDVSATHIVLGLVSIICAVAAAYGARWISRRSDEQMRETRAALRSRHAADEPAAAPEPLAPERPAPQSPAPQSTAPQSTGSRDPERPVAAPSQRAARRSPSTVAPPPQVLAPWPGETAPFTPAPHDDPEAAGRHRVPEELMHAVTYALSPDRVARAKVPGQRPQQHRPLPHSDN